VRDPLVAQASDRQWFRLLGDECFFGLGFANNFSSRRRSIVDAGIKNPIDYALWRTYSPIATRWFFDTDYLVNVIRPLWMIG